MRALLRSKNIDVRNNCGYNPINGSDRPSVEVPYHQIYYPPERALQSVGVNIIGSGFAGKPLRKELFAPPPQRNASVASIVKPEFLPPQHV